MSIPPLRIGSVPYLNSKVLIWGLDRPNASHTLELHPPSVLARKLNSGEVDVALLSSVELFRHPEYRFIPGLGVIGQQTMWSIRLLLRKPLSEARRIGLDPASETTNMFLRILLKEHFKLALELVALPQGADALKRDDLDGFLKIGDPALAFNAPGFTSVDLLGEWHKLTGLPFVFALWLARSGVEIERVEPLLQQARIEGFQHAEEIARAHHAETQISYERALEYVTKIVRYDLGLKEMQGLERFREYWKHTTR